ncbi:MAG TPA: ABC transporter ATP-binding protein [Methylomirabilota bacterium]|nr:ABC transporter ATP-binding protein [Methylomirabilota bacterium]
MAAPSPPLLALRGVTKAFPGGVRANDRVDLDVHAGEVHALVGENGAGKSTLVKIVYGFVRPDAGQIHVEGRPAMIASPRDARRLGIGLVFQELVQVAAFTVAENIAMFLPDLPAVLDRRAIARRIEATSAAYGLDVDPAAPVWQLSVGERQRVEIVKLLLGGARILLFDEPTRGLAPHEVDSLLRSFGGLRRDGYAVVFITHRLTEVLAGADRITVMRGGVVAGSVLRAAATEAALVSMMFGTTEWGAPTWPPTPPRRSDRPGGAVTVLDHRPAAPPVLELRGVTARPDGYLTGLDAIDLVVRPHEIVGVAGVAGNGQRELGDVILGLEPCAAGVKYLGGEDATRWPVSRARAGGVVFIPEDALGMAAVGDLTILENVALGDTRKYARHGGLTLDWAAAQADLDRSLGRLDVTVPSPATRIGTLSGGNVQRVILARELAREPRLIVAFYPTRGLDVRSAVAARRLMLAARDAGAGVLLISEDLGELFALADRLVVLFRGRIAGEGRPGVITMAQVGHLMTGTAAAARA